MKWFWLAVLPNVNCMHVFLFLVFLLQDSYESMDLKELLSADFSEIITAMNNSESHILQRLRQVQWLVPVNTFLLDYSSFYQLSVSCLKLLHDKYMYVIMFNAWLKISNGPFIKALLPGFFISSHILFGFMPNKMNKYKYFFKQRSLNPECER